MDEKHSFKHSKKQPKSHHSIDGFITPDSFKRPGSFDYDHRKRLDSEATNQVDHFNRPDGYHPANQLLAGSANQQISTILSSEPRQRHKPGEPSERTKRTKGGGRWHWRKIAKWTTIVAILFIVGIGGWLGFKFARNTVKVFHGNILGIFRSTKLKGEDQGRVTILLAGNSADDPGHDGANLTDSIMLISIDTVHNTGFTLSIPRDLWVDFGTNDCDYGNSGKINAVYECGQNVNFSQSGFPNGGMGLLEQDVEQDFGINIDYYALIDYSALRDAVNAVGGINFTVNSADPRGIYDPSIDYSTGGPLVKLSNGTHVLNGQQALDLARARGDAYGSYGFPQADFNRTQNQRQMLIALKDKALSAGVLSNPVKISSLFDSIGNNVKTDFNTSDIQRLYQLSKQVKDSSIQSIGLNDSNVNLVTTSEIDGQSVVIPKSGEGDYTQIQAYIKRLISNDPVAKEGASAVVLNGSGISGLARSQSTTLANRGISVSAVANASAVQTSNVVIDLNPKMTSTKSYLQQLYHVTAVTSTAGYPDAQNYQADFIIILGTNASSTTGSGSQ